VIVAEHAGAVSGDGRGEDGHGDRDDHIAAVRRILEGVIGVPATEGNRIDVLRNGDEIFAAMLEAIDEAQHTVDLLTFVYWQGEIVRVLLDGWGAQSMDRSLVTMMEETGVLVRWFRPLHRFRFGELNHRTHRKVVVVDEQIGFTGGVGIADEWQGDARNEHEWRDTHFRIHGAAVDGMRAAFLDNWAETDPVLFDEEVDRFPHQPKPGQSVVQCVRGAAETGWSDVATLFRTLLQLAEHRVRIATAYFVPDDELLHRLLDARERGVEVEIIVPGPHADKRFVQLAGEAVYQPLLDAGVALYSFQPSMFHAKVMTVDGIVANIGSANLNARSNTLDEEINVVVIDDDVVRVLDEQFEDDLRRSVRIEGGRWRRRSLPQRIAERITIPVRRVF
jgi:cardiolipin synthase A/B